MATTNMTHEVALEVFKTFCEAHTSDPSLEELNWYDLSMGFFLALGLPIEDAKEVAALARYRHQYWC